MSNTHGTTDERARHDLDRPSTRGIWLRAGLVLVVTAIVLVMAPAANLMRVAGAPAGFWLVVIVGPVLLAVLALAAARRHAGDDSMAMVPLALSLGGAAIATVIDRIYVLGFDGLAIPLALMAGSALSFVLAAPPRQNAVARSDDQIDIADALTVAVLTVVFVVLLTAEWRVVWRASAGLLQTGIGAADAAAGVAVAVSLAGFAIAASRYGRCIAIWMLWAAALAVVATVAWLAFASGHGIAVHGALGHAISALAERETALIKGGLSDFEQLKPMASPFLKVSLLDTLGAVAAIACGIAGITLTVRHMTGSSAAGGASAPRNGALSGGRLAVAVFLLTSLAGLVVFARIGLADAIAGGIAVADLPSGFEAAYRAGWLNICGAAWPADAAAACAARDVASGPLRLHDLTFRSDGFVLAAPLVGGLPWQATWLYWAGLALAAAAATVVLLQTALALWNRLAGSPPSANRALSTGLVALMVFDAAALAVMVAAPLADIFEYGLALSAAGLLAAGLLALRHEPPSAAGRITAIVTGLALFLAYVFAIGHYPADVVSAAGLISADNLDDIETFETFEALKSAVKDAASPAARDAAIAARDAFARELLSYGVPRSATAVLLAVPVACLAGWMVSALTSPRQRRRA